jgi:hypothetical protein
MEANLTHPPALLLDALADCYSALLNARRARLAKTNAETVDNPGRENTISALSDAPSKENVSGGIITR